MQQHTTLSSAWLGVLPIALIALSSCADGQGRSADTPRNVSEEPVERPGDEGTQGGGKPGTPAPGGADEEDASSGPSLPVTVDPGTGPFEPVARDRVADECGLDPALLDAADTTLNRRWGIVRYGKLCHEFYPGSDTQDTVSHVFSSTKTFAATVAGRLVYETRDLARTGPRTGPFDVFQRVDEWVDLSGTRYDIHKDATIAHVLAMVAYNDDLSFGQKAHSYDTDGSREINALSDILNAVIRQDTARLGRDLEEFTQRFVYAPLGMTHSTWTDGLPDKTFAFSWNANIHDMLRVGLLINNGGVWNGERLISTAYLYDMIHPAFEDGNTGYGYLTWLNGRHHRPPVVGPFLTNPMPADPCAPVALHRSYPHGISEAPDCGYPDAPASCAQDFDVGAWSAQGLGGNYIYGHRGLDLIIAIQDYGTFNLPDALWNVVRPAVVALDPDYPGDAEGFCAAYAANRHAPDLRLWEGGL
jgi:CubicO group peptidase (beta-lactamase class C family)